MNKFILAVLTILMAGCLDVTADVPSVCSSQNFTMVTDSTQTVGEVYFTGTYDMSGATSSITSLTNDITATITQFNVTNADGNLSWVWHVEATMESTNQPTLYPSVLVATYDIDPNAPASSTVDLQPQVDGTTLFKYLSQGSVTVTVKVSGGDQPAQAPNLTATMCMDLNVHVQKSLF